MALNLIQGKLMSEQSNTSTTSLLEHTPEDFQFEPKLQTEVRRISSMDDISRFYRYFHLLQNNLGDIFTWQQYLNLMRPEQDILDVFNDKADQTIRKEMNTAPQKWDSVEEPKSSAQVFLDEKEMRLPKLNKTNAVISKPSKNVSEISMTMSDFRDLYGSQPGEESVCVLINSSTTSLKNTSGAMMKMYSKTKNPDQNINTTTDIISRLPSNGIECGASLEGWGPNKNRIQINEIGGGAIENCKEMKLKGPIEVKHNASSTTASAPRHNFSEQFFSGEGESIVLPVKVKKRPKRKGFFKILAKFRK
ncbi:hypothetical protein JTE90_004595 [Oedothorax gibbosus]|uniref:Uncharacterized protein n=1 Tax=Oedothorax gibbosus TaxID=931172 RepID=A0AAV6UKU3_9ARAC|nr:hypothetical protein JTE90_004595 [Oedothorax gibbosus]